jgi:hypothetical protein
MCSQWLVVGKSCAGNDVFHSIRAFQRPVTAVIETTVTKSQISGEVTHRVCSCHGLSDVAMNVISNVQYVICDSSKHWGLDCLQ